MPLLASTICAIDASESQSGSMFLSADHSPTEAMELLKADQATQSSLKSSVGFGATGSSQSSVLSVSSGATQSDDELSQQYVTKLLQRANDLIENGGVSGEIKEVVQKLSSALGRSRAEANQYKLHSQLLSLTSRDQDMRNEVEHELVKREVDRLKTQTEQVEHVLDKVSRQKELVSRYKDKIVEKNKEINRLRAKLKRQRPNSMGENGMLDTLGLLASQVLTEENGK